MIGRRFMQNLLNWAFGKTPAATPAGVIYLSLHTASPGTDGQTSNEATGSGYARVATSAASWNVATAADPSVLTNAALIQWPTATGDWSGGANFTHVGMWAHATSTTEANFLGAQAIGTPRNVLNGDTLQLQAGAFSVTADS
jgi:hypothetical protein